MLVEIANTPEPYRSLKRAADILVSAAALVVLAPLILVIAAAILLTSGRPIIYRQIRLGIGGKPFTLYKFRSLIPGADRELEERRRQHIETTPDDPIIKPLKEDDLLTPIGRVLRQTSLDELPQFVNVLKGDMSLVGPRPPLPVEAATYTRVQARRLSVIPGLTCIWQVSGRSDIPFDRWIEMDLEYLRRRSLRFDLWLLLRTIPAVLNRKGAR